jgi:hypothetical protein
MRVLVIAGFTAMYLLPESYKIQSLVMIFFRTFSLEVMKTDSIMAIPSIVLSSEIKSDKLLTSDTVAVITIS